MTTTARPNDDLSLKAVHDDDLVAYLARLGVDEVDGVFGRCKFSGDAVTVENLAALFPQSGSLKLVCEKPDCLRQLQELIAEGRVSL